MGYACAFLSLMLVSVSIPLCAQTTKVDLTGGNVTLYGPGTLSGEPTSSMLMAPGYTITSVSGDSPANMGIGTLCNDNSGGCTPSQIGSALENGGSGIVGFPPNGSMSVNGQ